MNVRVAFIRGPLCRSTFEGWYDRTAGSALVSLHGSDHRKLQVTTELIDSQNQQNRKASDNFNQRSD